MGRWRISGWMATLIGSSGLIAAESTLLELPTGVYDQPVTVPSTGLHLHATAPTDLRSTVSFDHDGTAGALATIVRRSLRGVSIDDWRSSPTLAGSIAGTRLDADINRSMPAMGTADERKRFGITGTDSDWDDVSIQWDGWLRIPADGTELLTTSDDGSRLWLDRDHDGSVDAGEWGSNGWGGGQGATTRSVATDVPAGSYRFRVQWEDGFGPNLCQVQWKLPGAASAVSVPAEAFTGQGCLDLSGPILIARTLSDAGVIHCRDGVQLASIPGAQWSLAGAVALAADLHLQRLTIAAPEAELAIGAHRLELHTVDQPCTLSLQGGALTIAPGTWPLRVSGSGTLSIIGGGGIDVNHCDPGIAISHGSLRVADARGAHLRSRVRLDGPLTTVLTIATHATSQVVVTARITLPDDAPTDLGIGAWRADRGGAWWQTLAHQPLRPGVNELRFDLGSHGTLRSEGQVQRWDADQAGIVDGVGLLIYVPSQLTQPVWVQAEATADAAAPNPDHPPQALLDLQHDPLTAAPTGTRWELTLRPQPFPEWPEDPDCFDLRLEVSQPDGTSRLINGFHRQPMRFVDRGDREEAIADGAPRFAVRFRPTMPGPHRLRLRARWGGGQDLVHDLGTLNATGPAWDDIVRVDAQDRRFFSAGGRFVWPLGHNLNSVYDTRGQATNRTILTPDRGGFARSAYLARLIANGGTGTEVWLAPWNLGLEWTPKWPGYHGIGRYHQGHAQRLDELLDQAESAGMRVLLSIFNHGMARDGTAPEMDWPWHPYNAIHGGWLDKPAQLFTDERARRHQRNYFRYLAARYGDSPAVLGWKLWAEVDLAHAPVSDVESWHEWAASSMAAEDPWDHPITSHWCGDWNNVNRTIAGQSGIDFLTIDAYHGNDTFAAKLVGESVRDPRRRRSGLGDLGKPVWVSEFGGGAGSTNAAHLAAEHASGPWAGFVTGHAGSPLLWWFEWIDQGERYAVYRALRRFSDGEDLRGADARCLAFSTSTQSAITSTIPIWSRGWVRPGRILGYLADENWARSGISNPITTCRVTIGDVAAGTLTLTWWNADDGTAGAPIAIPHPGGALSLPTPPFERHVAFKLWREN